MKFSIKELSLLGVMTALTVVVQFTFGMIAMLFTAVPGVPNLIIGFFSGSVLYIALRKLPKTGSLTIMSSVYGLIFVLISGRTFNFIGLLIGGLAGDLFSKFGRGYNNHGLTLLSLVIFRGIASIVSSILPFIIGVTQSETATAYVIFGIIGTIIGTFFGAIFGKKIFTKLKKAGVAKEINYGTAEI
ncbi:MAG: MptD family putative ECF transporter S component [Candidatus Delongbacteria bacterium]|nr:MptD family putative ECF transporter S component [Candidatus Delongbacteria bacterium]MBN2833479.1 MptD family putative ECF transporter S component [Candidatus Delongbacteria bacterium]